MLLRLINEVKNFGLEQSVLDEKRIDPIGKIQWLTVIFAIEVKRLPVDFNVTLVCSNRH